MSAVDFLREALSFEYPLQHLTVQANGLQALNGVICQRPEEEKAKTLTVQTVIFLLLSPLAAAVILYALCIHLKK